MIIDLSHIINSDTPAYPGDPKPTITKVGEIDRDGFCDHTITIGTHLGTHIDAPMHMIKNGANLSQIAIDKFIGHGKLIDVSDGNYLRVLEANISLDDIVILYTGMSRHYLDAEYFNKDPVMPLEIARHLADKKIKMLGLDACSVDNQEAFPAHKILLEKSVLIIENLTNLDKLFGQNFEIIALPLKLELDGSPARVVARITSS